jgi:putative transposase
MLVLRIAMTDYRRNFIAGGSFFFTVNLAERRLPLLTEHIDELRTVLRQTRRHHPFTTDAMVVLPDHLHAVWTLPEGDADFATRWRLIKSAFSRNLATDERISESRAIKGERGIWQRRYWEHTIRDENDFAHHVDYIHINPVQAWVCAAGQGLAVFVVPSYVALAAPFIAAPAAGSGRTHRPWGVQAGRSYSSRW